MTDTTSSGIKRYGSSDRGVVRAIDGDFMLYADAMEWKYRLAAVTAELESEKNINKMLGSDVAGLRKSIDSLVDELEQSRAECERLRKDAEIGAAINRACEVLPDGHHVVIWLEKDSGDVELQCPDFQLSRNDFEHEADTFGGQINAAINAALAQQEKGDGN